MAKDSEGNPTRKAKARGSDGMKRLSFSNRELPLTESPSKMK